MAPFNNFKKTMQSMLPPTVGSAPPPKYLKKNGVTKLNPAYKKWKEVQTGDGQPGTTARYPKQALPVISNMDDHAMLVKDTGSGQDIPLAEATVATFEVMREPEYTIEAGGGASSDEIMRGLGNVLNKYECPMGLMNKLLILTEFEFLEFMVDDSGSMNMTSDTVDARTRQPQTRWREAQSRLKNMLEILAHVPFPELVICFLNRPDRISMHREGRSPEAFLMDAYRQIDQAFARDPAGTTPVLERIQESLVRGEGRSVSRYLFCDGQPNGGNPAKAEIVRLLMNRPNPQGNPMTFLSCTGEDDQVEWMKDAEEIISYCAECDDFNDEADEVYRDQGVALPFTVGFYLVCSLVAAMNPDDLDAMDESVPFTKQTLDNLLGIEHNEQTYRHYFDCFLQAQQKRTVDRDDYGRPKKTDQLKKSFNWRPLYNDFLRAPVANQIPAVQNFKAQLLQ